VLNVTDGMLPLEKDFLVLDTILDLLAAGNYWPALAVALMGLTSLVRWGGADAGLRWLAARIPGDDARQLDHLRAWIPLALAAAAWGVAVALPIDVDTREAAYALLIATIAAMAGHDSAKGIGAILVALLRCLGKGRGAAPRGGVL